MENMILPGLLLLLVCPMAASAQQSGQLDSKRATPPPAMCAAAAPKLRESGTSEVVLTMTVDPRGRVKYFSTNSPKGLRLEKMKEAADAINGLHFEPAKKDGRAVEVMIRVKFDCSAPQPGASKKQ